MDLNADMQTSGYMHNQSLTKKTHFLGVISKLGLKNENRKAKGLQY